MKNLLALYGLKWNPFLPELPVEALHLRPALESFLLYQLGLCWLIRPELAC